MKTCKDCKYWIRNTHMNYDYGECKNTTVVSEYGDTYTMINVQGHDVEEIELSEKFGCIFFEPKD